LHVRSQGKTDTHIRGDDAKCQKQKSCLLKNTRYLSCMTCGEWLDDFPR